MCIWLNQAKLLNTLPLQVRLVRVQSLAYNVLMSVSFESFENHFPDQAVKNAF